MKKIFTILATVLLTAALWAQSPEKMSYQAIIRNGSDALVTNTQIGMQISILQGSANGTVVYSETQTPTTNGNGLVSIEIGEEVGFSAIDWANDIYFIKTETDLDGGSNYTIMGTSQLMSVPYALHAKTAEIITGEITETDPVYEMSPAANISTTDITNLGNLSGTNTGDQTLATILTENTSAGNNKITNLADPTIAQDAATKAYVDDLEQQIIKLQNSLVAGGSMVKDYDGNVYGVTTIGTQKWMTENLKTTHFANGDEIPDGTGVGDISDVNSPIYWFAFDDDLSNVSTYGRLYTWYVVTDGRNVCPDGWHVPSYAEWTILTDYLSSSVGGKLKETGTTHWRSPNTGATNETGFTALPGSSRKKNGYSAYNMGEYGVWWSSTEYDAVAAWTWVLGYDVNFYYESHPHKNSGGSIRCIKD